MGARSGIVGVAGLLALLWPALAGAEGAPPAAPEARSSGPSVATPDGDSLKDPRWCLVCHVDERFSAATRVATAHHDQGCVDCHAGYHFNPHKPVELGPHAGRDADGATSARRRAVAQDRCTTCHNENKPLIEKVVHGGGEGAPTCGDCHGEAHTIVTAASLSPIERRRAMNARCAACHADAAKMAPVELTPRSVAEYKASVHGRKLHLGGADAPGCVDCHSGHTLTDLKDEGAETCGGCHSAATPAFVALGDHRPETQADSPAGYATRRGYAWLTFLVIAALALHVLLDLLASLRLLVFRRRRGGDA